MADAFDVATRKGLFRFERRADGWRAGPPDFLGEPVSAYLRDARDGTEYAALNHGHFGCKFHRRLAGGEWAELATPAYPAGDDASLDMIWTLVAGHGDHPGRIWAGTLPGGPPPGIPPICCRAVT